MDFNCFECGEPGHMVADCPARFTRKLRHPQFHGGPKLHPEIQARINERGMAKVRAGLARDWDLLDEIDAIPYGQPDEVERWELLKQAMALTG